MSSSVIRGGNLVVTEEGIREAVRQFLLPLWSTYYFFTLYAGAANDGEGYVARSVGSDGGASAEGLDALDRYVLARTRGLVERTTELLDAYDVAGACEAVREHLDVVTNWYVRTQRDRFWAEDHAAFDTLFTVLELLTRVMAPLAPLLTEEVWRGLTGGRSVHLTDWPTAAEPALAGLGDDADALVASMDEVRAVVSSAHGVRKARQVRVRQPLARLTVVVAEPEPLAPYTDLIASELNVKAVELAGLESGAAERFGISQRLSVNARAAGPRLGRGVQAVIKAAKAGDWFVSDADAVVVRTPDGDVPLEPTEYELSTVVGGDAADAGESIGAAVLAGGGFVVLDLALDDALRAEGYVRDLVRAVQDARKAAGLDVADRIDLRVEVPAEHLADVEKLGEFLSSETLATSLDLGPLPDAAQDRTPVVVVSRAVRA
jgi:isoleucyl-tRNA synthetase